VKIGILGATGSIGINALEVVRNLRENGFSADIVFLTTNNKIDKLATLVKEFKPQSVLIHNNLKAAEFMSNYSFDNLEILSGTGKLAELIQRGNYNLLINSLVGFAGLIPTLDAIKAGKKIALANKESIVVAGNLVNRMLKEYKTEIIPIDSEHSAILQCLAGEKGNLISKIILTASGGPFLRRTSEEIKNASVQDALNHPNWDMGNKITIDSATLMNKGMEMIEAKWLFNLLPEQIDVLIHPQSIVHSMVEFTDGSIKAQMGIPDMKIPIQYAITHPSRVQSDFPRMDFSLYDTLTFEKPDLDKFECLKLAFDIIGDNGTYSAVMNAANEIAVNLFLNGRIKFSDISLIVKKSMDSHKSINSYELQHIIDADRNTRYEILNNYKL